jgi:ribosomal protein L40E
MAPVCHRCGATLRPEEFFCPHCGAPQLRFEPSDEAAAPVSNPRLNITGLGPDSISWRQAVLSAVVVAVPVGILSSVLDFGTLWVIGGGIIVISLYRRRTGLPVSGRMGWRIGGLLGVLIAMVFTVLSASKLLLQRYVFHDSHELDDRIHQLVQQMTDQLSRSDPQTTILMAPVMQFWHSPDGAAALILSATVASALSMLLFAAAGGAIGARISVFGKHAASRPR